MTPDTRTRLHHAAAEAATLIANTGRGTKREGDLLAELRAALEADRELPELQQCVGVKAIVMHEDGDLHDEDWWKVVIPGPRADEEVCWCDFEEQAHRIADALMNTAPTMRDELRAWREAVTVERLEALDYLQSFYEADQHEANLCRDMLTALRAAVVAGDAGKGSGAK